MEVCRAHFRREDASPKQSAAEVQALASTPPAEEDGHLASRGGQFTPSQFCTCTDKESLLRGPLLRADAVDQ